MRKKYLIFSPVITDSFPLHKKIKKDLLKLISKSKGDSYQNKTSTMTDDLSKTDWPLSNDFSRPWVKKYGPMIKDFLTKQVLQLVVQIFILANLIFVIVEEVNRVGVNPYLLVKEITLQNKNV